MLAPARIHSLEVGTACIGLILNPLGGQARKRLSAIKQILAEMPDILQWEVTHAPDFDVAVKALIQAKLDWLIILGGDGTVQGILNRLFAWLPTEQWPALTIIPGGTTNMTALDLGSRDKPDTILQRIKHLLQQPTPRPCPFTCCTTRAVHRTNWTGKNLWHVSRTGVDRTRRQILAQPHQTNRHYRQYFHGTRRITLAHRRIPGTPAPRMGACANHYRG
jgi:hypothetical protein